jgi:PAS domain S-box-containing protein
LKATHKIAASLAGAALLVALGLVLSFWAFQQIKDAAEARKHAFVVINSANDVLSELLDAETGQRGFTLTGDEAFLEPYLAVRGSVNRHLEELRQLTSVSAAQAHLTALAPLVDAKLAEMSQVIELRRYHDTAAALAKVSGGQGKRLMDSIRAEMKAFVQIEDGALAQHEAQFQSNMRRLFIIIAAASLFTLLLALSFAYLVYRETRHRLRHQVHLETQHLLEIQNETNKQLQQANVTLQASEEKLAVTLNSIGDGVIATDAEGRVTRLNPLAAQLTGWTQAQAAGRPVNEIFHIINQETRQPAIIPVNDTLAHGTIHGLANHTLLIALDGSECAIADSCAPICDRDGQVIGAVLVFRDVTEEYAAQQALRDNAELIQTILNTAVDGIITLHASGGILETLNPATERMFGYSAAELIGQNFGLLIPELDLDQRNGSLEYYRASDEAHASGLGREVVGRRKDGSSFPMEMAVSEMWLGGQRYFTGILRDITARKRAEEDRNRFFALSQDVLCILGFDGYFKDLNPAWGKTLGYTKAELLTTPFIEFVHPDDRQATLTEAEKVSSGEALIAFENRYRCKDGSYRWFQWSVTPVIEDRVMYGVARDVTGRKQEEAALLESRALQSAIFNSANFSCIATDAKGVIQIFNVGAERMMGFTAAEVVNQITPADLHDPQEVIARATALSLEFVTPIAPGFEALAFKASRGIEDIYELTKIRKDGSRFPAVVSVTALRDAQDSIIGYLLIGTDNTARWQVEEERKRFEQALQETNIKLQIAKSAAEKANLAKSEFLSNMSHELRTPLNAILGFAQLMESASPSPAAPQAKRIAQILHAGWYLLKLINEVLDLAAIESGKLSLSKESVSLSEVMSECQSMMEPQAQQRGIRMSFPQFDNPVFVSADRTRLKQIVINLVSNAIKYNQEQGTVVVDCTVVVPDHIRISVKDTGAGLPPEKLAQLFTPFNRLGQEVGSVAGTGIGLVVSKRLAEQMGGVIRVESTVGVGSVFWCELRSAVAPQLAVQDRQADALVQPESSVDAPRRTLLYVEDNPANMELVQELIARFPDLGLVTAVDGTLGVELARVMQPTVILMDINLPGISGIKALQILRADPATAHIPVIALSANAMPRDIEKGLQAGFFHYLTKPIKIKEFMDTLNAALKFAEKTVSPASHAGQLA